MVLQFCLFSEDPFRAFRFFIYTVVSMSCLTGWTLQSIVQNSSIDLPCDDLFGFHRARQKFLLPLITQISLQSDDLAELDVHSPSDADLDFGMYVDLFISDIKWFVMIPSNAVETGLCLISKMNPLGQLLVTGNTHR
jgi:hypothetical protein